MKKINKILLTTLTALTILFTTTLSGANIVEAASGDKFPAWFDETITLVKDDGTVVTQSKYINCETWLCLKCNGVVKKRNYKKKTITVEFITVDKESYKEGYITTDYILLPGATEKTLETFIQYGRGYNNKLKFTKTIKLKNTKRNKKITKKEFNKLFKKGTKLKYVIITTKKSKNKTDETYKKRLMDAEYNVNVDGIVFVGH